MQHNKINVFLQPNICMCKLVLRINIKLVGPLGKNFTTKQLGQKNKNLVVLNTHSSQYNPNFTLTPSSSHQ